MNNKERIELAGWAITRAKQAGADEVAVDIGGSRDIEIEYCEKKLEKLKESKSNSLSLDIYTGNKYSSHSTNDLKKESLGKFIEEAVAMTKYLTEDEFRALPDPKYYQGRKDIDLQLRDDKYEALKSEKRVGMAEEIERVVMAQSDQVISCTSYVGDSLSEGIKVHSNGFEGAVERTSFYAGAEVTVRDGESGRPQDSYFKSVRFLKDIDNLEFMGKEAVRRTLEKIGQAKIASGVYDMLIENRAASRLLYYLQGALTGSALQQKRTFLDGMLDKQIASEKLTVIDDPFIVGGMGSRLYDNDGMAAKKRVIIDKGVLKYFLINNYYARKLGVEPTGGSTSNMVFDYGTRSLDEMVRDVHKGILVTGFIGGNANNTTGDFSVGIVGLYIEDGKIVKPVNEMNVAGNQKELWNQLVEVGNDPYIYSSIRRPSLYFKDIQFSGI
ncbi:MAG: TldD/PmbA family protein [candidate division Zixibacteria bacterium]|nr:TldD/PmbA family protein [candidate division Zixibacteria bacterium]